MGIAMPHPVLIGNTYYLRVSVPKDVAQAAKGKKLLLPVGDALCPVTVGAVVKVSLQTKSASEAKQRHTAALAVVHQFWEALRAGPKPLSHKQALALAGEVYRVWVEVFDEDPAQPSTWLKVLRDNTLADTGNLDPWQQLKVNTETEKARAIAKDRELRFGPFTDVVLAKHGLDVDAASRARVLEQVSYALTEAALVNHAKASGDYSNSGETSRYPAFETPAQAAPQPVSGTIQTGITFKDVIDRRVEELALGRYAKPMPKKTETKYRKATDDFADYRKSQIISTVTSREGAGWKRFMLEEGKLSQSTIAQRIQNVSTVIEWARKQALGELFKDGNPFELVERPDRNGVRSEDRTYTLEEARTILLAARRETKPELRWLPWICAYTGARIKEVSPTRPSDFLTIEGEPFLRITTKGGRSVKNIHSERRVPIHPDLVAEGLLDFFESHSAEPEKRLFPHRSGDNISAWVKRILKNYRKDIAPNHSWRHLFEDKARAAGMIDSAREIITGRATTSSSGGYGKSDVMLAGLTREMRKITPYLKE